MGRAEAGSTKAIANKMKSKGLQRLRWYCQTCEKQCRDENGFKMHTQSESHVRQLLIVGEDPKKHIEGYSRDFQQAFLQLLKTSHGEKSVHMNRFYQVYIQDKNHVHQNATKWNSLTEFAKHLGREGLCRVEENEKGIHIAWIDNSAEALKRKEAVRRKEMQDKGDEEREQRMIREQIKRANREAGAKDEEDTEDAQERELKREEGEKIKLSFGAKPAAKAEPKGKEPIPKGSDSADKDDAAVQSEVTDAEPKAVAAPLSLKMAAKPQPKNVFAAAKKNALVGGSKKPSPFEQPKKMSEAERIMREEMEKNKKRSVSGFGTSFSFKKQKTQ